MNEEEIKTEFGKIWNKIRELEEKNKKSGINVGLNQESMPNNSLESELKIFCKNNDLDEKRLRYEIDFQEVYPHIINHPKEKVRTKLQFKVLILLAPLYLRVYGKTLSENTIRGIFELNRVPLERMDKLYNSPPFKKFFTKSATNIKLSWAGEQEGINKLKELIENETNNRK